MSNRHRQKSKIEVLNLVLIFAMSFLVCCRRPKIDPPRRLNIDPGRAAVFGTAAVDKSTKQLLGALLFSLLYRQMHKESAKRIAIPCALA